MKEKPTSKLYQFPKKGEGAFHAYQKISSELALDGNVHLDLGSFSTTSMDPFADKLITEQLGKNFIDYNEYGQSKKIHDRIVRMLSGLLYAPEAIHPTGTSTLGSSEAIHLALLSHKWNWKKRRESFGLSTSKPNIVYSGNAHVCWDKFALYFDVEPRKIPQSSLDSYPIEEILKNIDQNTICVGTIAGNTYTGSIDHIEKLNDEIARLNKKHNWNVGIHVDAAIGGFVLPFIKKEVRPWDFRLPLVRSINLSGHKYGLVYPGIGWLIFRDNSVLPKELIFSSHYLEKPIETYALNFSKGASMILAQYFSILQQGQEGYKKTIRGYCKIADTIRKRLQQSGYFEIIDEGILPVVVFKLKDKKEVDTTSLLLSLRSKNWMLPAYFIPGIPEQETLMRVVVKENISLSFAQLFCDDLICSYETLKKD
ncbi:glutamate decarboxylase [Flavobacterium sp. 28YEA47A]|uniref:glutamate decarboxylase n=1 Tax=Flavobacterium sp. 28YEA47A TaxID=3156276 RepID=UPI003513B1C8